MDAQVITDAALGTLEDVGLDKLTMRAIAARLGVHVGGLYYHLPDKSALVRLMADRLCAEIGADATPTGEWRTDVLELCVTTRRVLLAHRDGARVLALSPLATSEGALTLMERLLGLLAGGVRPGVVNVAGDALLSYVTGFVLQEQPGGADNAMTPERLGELTARYPLVFTDDGHDADASFALACAAIVDGFAA